VSESNCGLTPDSNPPRAGVLGRLLLLQGALEASADERQLAGAFCRCIEGLPGLSGCALCLDGKLLAASAGFQGGAVCPPCPEGNPLSPACSLRQGGETVCFELAWGGQCRGAVWVEVGEPAAWAPYAPYAANAVGMVALHFSNREQTRNLCDLNQRLDSRVVEQTRELAYQHERMDLALRAVPMGIWDWDCRTGEVRCEARWLEWLGYSAAEPFLAISWWSDLIHPEDRARADAAYLDHAEGRSPSWGGDLRLRTATGEWLWVQSLGRVVERDADGKPVRVCGTHLDISERKRTEERLRVREQMWRSLATGMPDVVARIDRDERYLFISDNVSALLSLEAAQIVGKTIRELGFSAAECDRREALVRDAFARRVPLEAEFEIDRPGCKRLVVTWRLIPEFDERGEVSSLLCITRDVTAQRNLEAVYSSLFREMPDAYAVYEVVYGEGGEPADYRVLSMNPAFERLTGLSATESAGRLLLDVMPNAEQLWLDAFAKVAVTGEPMAFEAYAQGVSRHLDTRIFRPGPGRLAALYSDITPRKEAEADRQRLWEQLTQAQKMESIGRLAGGVAHDFNNLLTVINGYAKMMRDQLGDADPLRESAGEILKAGERAAGLTGQLLAFGRKQVLEPRAFDLNHLVEELRPMLVRLVGEDIEVLVAHGKDPVPVSADFHQLEQVVLNLAVNARDAMPDGGRLLIEVGVVQYDASYVLEHPDARPGRYAMLAVSDTGAGMDAETQRRIFEPFFTTKEVGQGTGLGLAVVQGVVLQSGGFLNVYSEPGCGATFKVYLPLLDQCHSEAASEPATPIVGCGERVLVVEDQEQVRAFALSVLTAYGFHPVEAGSPEEAIEILERDGNRIEMVLTDVVMPRMSGRELTARLLQLRPALKVLYMSGYTDNVIAHHGILDQGVNFIQKPFGPRELAGKVRTVLGPPRATRVLVVDDEPAVRSFLRAVLERGGYEVYEESDGRNVVARARILSARIVVTDLVMPEMEGIETIRALRREIPGIGIVAISGAFDGQFLQTARKLGAGAVLSKPVSINALLDAVKTVSEAAS
jgi:two-component system, cell cycle sensor histidine kinase and response regulator CckA